MIPIGSSDLGHLIFTLRYLAVPVGNLLLFHVLEPAVHLVFLGRTQGLIRTWDSDLLIIFAVFYLDNPFIKMKVSHVQYFCSLCRIHE